MVANMTGEQADHGSTVRALIRAGRRASLATLLPEEGAAPGPYVSLVMIAADLDASPLLLLSDLALHARNLATDPRAALLFDGTEGLAEPLAGERATVTGRVERVASEGLRARYLRYHPDAARYAAFADFALYRMRVTGAHLVAGFGRIASVPAAAVLLPAEAAQRLAAVEGALLDELAREQSDGLQLLAHARGAAPGGWRPIGLDPEGLDLARERERLRVPFPAPVTDAEQLRAALVGLLQQARRQSPAKDAI